MAVNGRNVLSLDYSRAHRMEKIYDDHTKFMLRIQVKTYPLTILLLPQLHIYKPYV